MTHYIPPNVSQFSDGDWYWRVRVDAPTASEYSDPPWPFERQWASPDNDPKLISPLDGSIVEFYDTSPFLWQPVMGASSYRIQIATAPDFKTVVYNAITLGVSHQPDEKLANGTYFWRVIPINPANKEGTYSVTWSFEQAYNQVPDLLKPEDGTYPTFTPTISWTAERGAEFDRLQYSTDPTFNTDVTTI